MQKRAYGRKMMVFDNFAWHVYMTQIIETKIWKSILQFYDSVKKFFKIIKKKQYQLLLKWS